MDGDVDINLNDRESDVLTIEASHKFEEWTGIREIGNKLVKKAEDIGQEMGLDNLTRGSGNCFPISVLQQLRRAEIFEDLDSNLKEIATSINHMEFRTKVAVFMMRSKLPNVVEYRKQVEEITGTKWSRYCQSMTKKGAYVDSHFVQCTAWYLKKDIWILDQNCTVNRPFVKIQCDEQADTNSTVLFMGLADEHYQSLLPRSSKFDNKTKEKTHSTTQSQTNKERSKENGKNQTQEFNKCPICGKEGAKILWHISRTKACKEAFGAEN